MRKAVAATAGPATSTARVRRCWKCGLCTKPVTHGRAAASPAPTPTRKGRMRGGRWSASSASTRKGIGLTGCLRCRDEMPASLIEAENLSRQPRRPLLLLAEAAPLRTQCSWDLGRLRLSRVDPLPLFRIQGGFAGFAVCLYGWRASSPRLPQCGSSTEEHVWSLCRKGQEVQKSHRPPL